MIKSKFSLRRSFLSRLTGVTGLAALAAGTGEAQSATNADTAVGMELPAYARTPQHQTLKQSSFDRTGGNKDFFRIASGQTLEVFKADGPGIVTHIWFTIAAQGVSHLKELVLRIYWDGVSQPSVEVPVGDFFGLNLGDYFIYQSAFLNCSSVKGLNAYFAMPFRRSARVTITNEGAKPVGSFYSNIDYQLVKSLPEDAMYFHAQYRQATPTRVVADAGSQNLDGANNYTFLEANGKGQLLGVTLGVIQNSNEWFGEGDDMTTIDSSPRPVMTGTGTEDYFCGAWNFGVGSTFAHLYNGAPYMGVAERVGGRYCLYRWHADNPIAFEKSIRHTIEHGHGNDRADCFYSVAYWYQTQPATHMPVLPRLADRLPQMKLS